MRSTPTQTIQYSPGKCLIRALRGRFARDQKPGWPEQGTARALGVDWVTLNQCRYESVPMEQINLLLPLLAAVPKKPGCPPCGK